MSLTTLRNTAFQDEGLYVYAGRQIIRHWMGGPAPLDNYAYYFSGYPYVYPVVGGFLDRVGGLELARSFSLACMLGVTSLVYSVTRNLFDRASAIFASGMYAVTGVVLFVGRLAVFDAMCLFFIALATAIAVHCSTRRRAWPAFLIGPALATGVMAKYAGLIFVAPVLVIMLWLSLRFLGWRAAAGRLFYAASGVVASVALLAVIVNHDAFHAVSGSTTNRSTGFKAPRLSLFNHALQMGGVIWGAALIAIVMLLRRKRYGLLALMFFGTSWLTVIYHVYMREPISFDKHIAYGLFFAVPLAGYALAWISGYVRPPLMSSNRGYWLAGTAVLLAVFVLGLHQSQNLYARWANTSDLSYALHTQLRNGTGRILAEDIEVARFDARDVTQEWQWSSFYYPFYIDAAKHKHLGDDALHQGLNDRYYDLIELSFNYFPDQAYGFAGYMAQTRNYDLIGRVPFTNSYGKGHFFLFRSALGPRQGTFTSLDQLKTNVWP